MLPEADILLVRPPSFAGTQIPTSIPTGLLALSGFLKREGYRVLVRDLDHGGIEDDIWDALKRGAIPVVGITMLSFMRKTAYGLIRRIKATNPSVKVVVGGIHATALSRLLVDGTLPIDAAVIGEGEHTALDLLRCWVRREMSVEDVRGVATPEHGLAPQRPLIDDLDSLPIPDYDQIDFSRFHWPLYATYWPGEVQGGMRLAAERYAHVFTDRGCIGRCSFCNWQHWRGKPRSRSASHVFGELEHLYARGVRTFNVSDEAFGQDREAALDLCRKIVTSGMTVRWQTTSRADLLDEELLGWMKEAGCLVISIGIESGSEQVLRNIHKRITVDQIRRAVGLVKRAGIMTFGLFMVGNVGETDETIEATIALLSDLKLDLHSALGQVWVFPGTELERHLIRRHGFDRRYWLEDADGVPSLEDGFTAADCARWTAAINQRVPWGRQPECRPS